MPYFYIPSVAPLAVYTYPNIQRFLPPLRPGLALPPFSAIGSGSVFTVQAVQQSEGPSATVMRQAQQEEVIGQKAAVVDFIVHNATRESITVDVQTSSDRGDTDPNQRDLRARVLAPAGQSSRSEGKVAVWPVGVTNEWSIQYRKTGTLKPSWQGIKRCEVFNSDKNSGGYITIVIRENSYSINMPASAGCTGTFTYVAD
jgi:hypothetical protein